jgi:amino acid transporter
MVLAASHKKNSMLGAVVAGIAALCLSLVPSMSASAAASPGAVCGAGYYVQRSHDLPGARVYQLYNGNTNCVVTVKDNAARATRTSAGLQVAGGNWAYDTGDYVSYAGPVKQYAKDKCVRYFGYHGGANFTSAWGNCK